MCNFSDADEIGSSKYNLECRIKIVKSRFWTTLQYLVFDCFFAQMNISKETSFSRSLNLNGCTISGKCQDCT